MRAAKSVATAAVAVAAVLGGSVYAFAGWAPATSSAVLRMRTAEMPAGNAPSVVLSGRSAVIAWGPSRLAAGVRAQDYTVVRAGAGGPVVACARVTALTCRDRALPAGTWVWQVQPRYENWTGDLGAASVPLTVAGPVRPTPAAATGVTTGAVQGLGEAPAAAAKATVTPEPATTPAPPSPEPEAPEPEPPARTDDVVDSPSAPPPSMEPSAS